MHPVRRGLLGAPEPLGPYLSTEMPPMCTYSLQLFVH